jgi:corrinoid protein of di/trimethylamine methyltransferase
MEKAAILESMTKAILEGNSELVCQGAKEAVDQKIDPLEVVELGLSKGMEIVGDRFENGEAFLPELIMAADTFKAAMKILKPEIAAQKKQVAKTGTVLIATVKGDLHDIGKNIVATVLETRGFSVVDLGIDVPTLQIIEEAEKVNADIIALSCLMTTTMPNLQGVLTAMEEMNVREQYRVIIGGGALTHKWADEIGADGYGTNAIEAVNLVKHLMSQ